MSNTEVAASKIHVKFEFINDFDFETGEEFKNNYLVKFSFAERTYFSTKENFISFISLHTDALQKALFNKIQAFEKSPLITNYILSKTEFEITIRLGVSELAEDIRSLYRISKEAAVNLISQEVLKVLDEDFNILC